MYTTYIVRAKDNNLISMDMQDAVHEYKLSNKRQRLLKEKVRRCRCEPFIGTTLTEYVLCNVKEERYKQSAQEALERREQEAFLLNQEREETKKREEAERDEHRKQLEKKRLEEELAEASRVEAEREERRRLREKEKQSMEVDAEEW
jgi:hypothetical protein